MIYIVTPVFNRKSFTQNYLKALDNQTNKNFKVIIIDDGSTDGTSEMIEKNFSDVILLKEKGDLWWAEATNVGVRHAIEKNAEYIMTLNDDTLPHTDYIENMYHWIEKKPKALLGALAIEEGTGKIINGGELHHWKDGSSTYLLDKLSTEDQTGIHEVNVFPGRGLLIPSEVFKNIGLYDSKNFPQTVADNDFSFRAVNNGYKIYINYDAKIKTFSEESATIKLVKNRNFKNYFYHILNKRGGGNIIYFTKLALKNCPKKYLIQYLAIGLSKRLFSYLINWFFETMKIKSKE